ncbi:MAG: GDSL-type esterase/lipase family protein [Gemmatimonadales bacterium]
MPFVHYVALGDSMSSDHYPTCDVRGLDLPPARLDPLGAAALLHRDLEGRSPGIGFTNLTEDGAMIDDVLTEELARLGRDSDDPRILVTLTAGGNDLLDAVLAGRPLDSAVEHIRRRYTELVATLREELPRATLVLTTVYDPTDGTGRLPGFEPLGPLPLEYLERFNLHLRETARRTPGATLADVHRHFLGHGVTAPEGDRWYWQRNLIEPSARGASEIRRVWWHALG